MCRCKFSVLMGEGEFKSFLHHLRQVLEMILGLQFFPVSTLNMSAHCLPAFKVSDEKSVFNLNEVTFLVCDFLLLSLCLQDFLFVF